MKIGFVGLGRLGFPCALAAAMKGHDVMAYDIDFDVDEQEPPSLSRDRSRRRGTA